MGERHFFGGWGIFSLVHWGCRYIFKDMHWGGGGCSTNCFGGILGGPQYNINIIIGARIAKFFNLAILEKVFFAGGIAGNFF